MEPEELRPSIVTGWHIVEAGRRQAWPFVGLADPQSGREVRLYIDSTFSVLPGWPELGQHDDAAMPALDELNGLTVIGVRRTPGEFVAFELEGFVLTVSEVPNALTSGSPWSIGHA